MFLKRTLVSAKAVKCLPEFGNTTSGRMLETCRQVWGVLGRWHIDSELQSDSWLLNENEMEITEPEQGVSNNYIVSRNNALFYPLTLHIVRLGGIRAVFSL